MPAVITVLITIINPPQHYQGIILGIRAALKGILSSPLKASKDSRVKQPERPTFCFPFLLPNL